MAILYIYDFSYFLSASCPDTSYQVFSQLEKKSKIDFLDGIHGSYLEFPIGTILALFDLQVASILPTKVRVNRPFCSGKEAQKRFQDGGHSHHLGFPIRNGARINCNIRTSCLSQFFAH